MNEQTPQTNNHTVHIGRAITLGGKVVDMAGDRRDVTTMTNTLTQFDDAYFVRVMKHFTLYLSPGCGWFRIFGAGIRWKDLRRYQKAFSERNGHRKALQIGNWLFSYLPR